MLTKWLLALDRRWQIGVAVALAVVVGLLLWNNFRGPSEQCRPVRALLDFNTEQGAAINKADNGAALNLDAYQTWANGMAERAAKVTDPELAPYALRLADDVDKFVLLLPKVPTDRDARAPEGTKPPAEVAQLSVLNDQIAGETKTLSEKCPR